MWTNAFIGIYNFNAIHIFLLDSPNDDEMIDDCILPMELSFKDSRWQWWMQLHGQRQGAVQGLLVVVVVTLVVAALKKWTTLLLRKEYIEGDNAMVKMMILSGDQCK